MIIIYGATCAALIALRRQRAHADALRIPFGRVLAVTAIIVLVAVLTPLTGRQAFLMGVTVHGRWLRLVFPIDHPRVSEIRLTMFW